MDAALSNLDASDVEIIEEKWKVPDKYTLMKCAYLWLLQKQINIMAKYHCAECVVNSPGPDPHEEGDYLRYSSDSIEYYFSLIHDNIFIYWNMLYDLCEQIQKHVDFTFSMYDCCFPFNYDVKRDLVNQCIRYMIDKPWMTFFEYCFDRM